ncbi:hypothetical protein T265_01161 [Opisthorchis viverrini]|uniref:Uncharacterized protein n=1 Tax=Opisthorchis viverrini TaxID=6198 RepID=A0A075AAP9_OPIVI|nr:hypothetical protein T265_01161 [Opisthorchis viverrini]KER32875.1 hypothetical protein T265_01161 [Opisthorchis viverrini]
MSPRRAKPVVGCRRVFSNLVKDVIIDPVLGPENYQAMSLNFCRVYAKISGPVFETTKEFIIPMLMNLDKDQSTHLTGVSPELITDFITGRKTEYCLLNKSNLPSDLIYVLLFTIHSTGKISQFRSDMADTVAVLANMCNGCFNVRIDFSGRSDSLEHDSAEHALFEISTIGNLACSNHTHLQINLVSTRDSIESLLHDILQQNVLHTGHLMFQLARYSRYRSTLGFRIS